MDRRRPQLETLVCPARGALLVLRAVCRAFPCHACHRREYNFGNMHNGLKFLGSDFSKLGEKRYQGWAAGLGIGYGHTWILSRHWSIEAEAALGWIYTRFDTYPCAHCGTKLDRNRVLQLCRPDQGRDKHHLCILTNDSG